MSSSFLTSCACWEHREHSVLFCPSHNCGYDADGDSGQEGVQRPGYRGELHPGYLQYILPAAYLLHSHRALVITWGLSVSMWPQDGQAPCFPTCHTVAGCWYLLVQYSWLSIKQWISTTLENKWRCQDCENMKHFYAELDTSQWIKMSRILFSLDLSLVAIWCLIVWKQEQNLCITV